MASEGCSSLGAQASHCGGFSCCGAQALGMWPSVVVARGLSSCGSWALERRLSTCAAQAQLLCGMRDLPGPGLEPVSPALAGGFLTTAPPGKSSLLDARIIGQQNRPESLSQGSDVSLCWVRPSGPWLLLCHQKWHSCVSRPETLTYNLRDSESFRCLTNEMPQFENDF